MDLLTQLNANPWFTALAVLMALVTLPIWALDVRKACLDGSRSLFRPLCFAIISSHLVTANFWKVYAFAGEAVTAGILVVFLVYCCLIHVFASPVSPPASD